MLMHIKQIIEFGLSGGSTDAGLLNRPSRRNAILGAEIAELCAT